jgi:AraC-like DNA-binding protein
MVPIVAAQLSLRGIDVAQMLAAARLPEGAATGELTAPLGRIRNFIDAVGEKIDDDIYGVHLADAVPAGAFGFAEFVMRTAPTVQVALEALSTFAVLINPIGSFTVQQHGKEHSHIDYHVSGSRDGLGTHLNEYTIALVTRSLNKIIEGGVPMSRVWFAHRRSKHRAELAKYFGCEVEFGAATSGFSMRNTDLHRVPRGHDAALHEFLVTQSRSQLANTGRIDAVGDVSRAIEARLPAAGVSADDIARALGLSSRSMQRRLLEAGTSYGEVLDHVRHRRYSALSRSGRAFDAAHELGFSNARSVRRCIARWRGETSDTPDTDESAE